MSAQSEALRLADDLAKYLGGNTATQAAAELRRLSAENETLKRTLAAPWPHEHEVLVLPPLSRLHAQRDALLEALKGITPPMPPADAPCHVGLVPQEKCAHCGRIARARAAIKAVEENT